MKRSRKDVDGPSLARNEEVEVEDAHSDTDEDEDYHGSGAVTLKTLVGLLTVDARVAIAVQHLLFDGPEHPLYAGHMDAIISQCDGASTAESGYQLQRMCEFVHAQAAELDMVPKGSQLEEEVRTVWAKEQGQALAEQIKGTSAFPDVIAAMVMGQAEHSRSSNEIKNILLAVEDRCDKQAQATMVDDNVPQDSAGPGEHLTLPYHPDTDAPAAIVAKPDAMYRPLSAAYCQPFSATPYQSFFTGSAAEQASKTGPTIEPAGFNHRGFSAASVAEKVFPSGPAPEATRSFPRSVSAFSTGEPPIDNGTASSDREEPGQEQSAVQNANSTGGGNAISDHPLRNWIVKPAVKVEKFEEDGSDLVPSASAQVTAADNDTFRHPPQQAGDGPALPASAKVVAPNIVTCRHALQQYAFSNCVVVDTGNASNKQNVLTNAIRFSFQGFGWRATERLRDRRWLVRLGSSDLAKQAASRTFELPINGAKSQISPKLYLVPQVFTAIMSNKTIMPDLLISISTLYQRPFCLQYLDNSPFAFVMVLTLSEKINVKKFQLSMDGSSTTVQFTTSHVPVGNLTVVPTPPQVQAYHLNSPPTAVQD
ncbi:hypothetical protein KC318_g2033 [Hortaea werneckii]|nr:hypothetical protein KC334_g4933 [Hortaea werneckii]KAI7013235.1 hypothetical protein KC355_g5115 [Hortaea werneckii]KAI7673754.1 hypothetical protein KC318_g2033 [Hortaea werneckii]